MASSDDEADEGGPTAMSFWSDDSDSSSGLSGIEDQLEQEEEEEEEEDEQQQRQNQQPLPPADAGMGLAHSATAAETLVLTSAQGLEQVLEDSRRQFEELRKSCKANTRAARSHIEQLEALLGGAKVLSHSDPLVRRMLCGDASGEEAKSVSSLRLPAEFFFGRRPPMDARGRELQGQVIDHQGLARSSFNLRAREALVNEVLASVKIALWEHAIKKCSHDPLLQKQENQRLRSLSIPQSLDEAERAGIFSDNGDCKVWQKVSHIMWKHYKMCSAECRIQFLNNDDPRIFGSAAGSLQNIAGGTGGSNSGSTGWERKPRVACEECAARKIKCKHVQNEDGTWRPGAGAEGSGDAGEGSSGDPAAQGGWTKAQAARMVSLVAAQFTWQVLIRTGWRREETVGGVGGWTGRAGRMGSEEGFR